MIALLAALVTLVAAPTAVAASTTIGAASPSLRYEGRWEVRASGATTVTSGSRLFLRFTGTAVSARFNLLGITKPPHLYAYVDGVKGPAIIVDRSPILLTPLALAAGEHTLELVVKDVHQSANRWVRPFSSALQLQSLEVPAETVLHPPPPVSARRFTFLGDSITQGISITCATGGSDCADSTLDYARLVADAFGASLEQIGFGGQGLTRGGGGGVPPAPSSLGLNFNASPASAFDAQVVVINEGINDVIRKDAPTEATFRAAYVDYLRRVRARYPNATLIALEPFGVFGGENSYAGPAIQAAVAQFADARTKYVSTREWVTATDFTDPFHPNVQGHRKIADRLIPVLQPLAP